MSSVGWRRRRSWWFGELDQISCPGLDQPRAFMAPAVSIVVICPWCNLLLEVTVLTKADRRRTGRRKKEAAKTSFSQRWNASDLVHTMKKAFIVCDKLSTSKDNSIRLATCGHTPFQHKVKLGWLMLYLYPLC